jgi:DnaJ-class molecular chaperone
MVLFSFWNASIIDVGEVISERDKCPPCKGSKVTQEKKVLEVHVEKGMQHGEKIVFEGQADQAASEITFVIGQHFVYFLVITLHCSI